MKRLVVFFFLFVLGTGGILFFTRDWIVKAALESAVRSMTGFDSSIRTLRLDFGQAILQVKGLTILNPYDFEERIFADIPEVYIRLDLPALLKERRTHIPELRLNIRELDVEKNRQGISNVSLLTSVGGVGTKGTPSSASGKEGASLHLDRLELTLRRVRYSDYSGFVPKRLSADLKIESHVIEGIQDSSAIVNLVLMKVITGSPFGNLLGLNPDALQNEIDGAMKKTFSVGDMVFSKAPTAVSQKVEGTVNEIQSMAKEKFSGLFEKVRSLLQGEESVNQEASHANSS